MKLQLLTLVAIVTTVTALPTLGATNTYEKRAGIECTYNTLGKACEVVNVEGMKVTATSEDVSLVCRRVMFSTIISLVTDPICCE